MVSPVNGAGSQATALVNPFENKPDQQNRIKNDDPSKPKETGNAFSLIDTQKKSGSTSLAQAQSSSGQDNKAKAQGRGSLVNITV